MKHHEIWVHFTEFQIIEYHFLTLTLTLTLTLLSESRIAEFQFAKWDLVKWNSAIRDSTK